MPSNLYRQSNKLLLCGLYLPFYLPCYSAAQLNIQPAAHSLDTVVVTADQHSSTLADSALRTMVISAAELQKIHARTLEDALKYTAGISIKPIGNNAESGAGVSIQGLDPSQVLIMVDGNPIAPNSGEMLDVVDISQVLLGNVESIEVVKGGASALYGANAMGGVVNIITKNPDQPFSLSADLSAGNWGDKTNDKYTVGRDTATITAASRTHKLTTQISADLVNQQGYDLDSNNADTDGWHGFKNNFSASARYQINQNHTLQIAPKLYRAETSTYKVSQGIEKSLVENKVNRDRNSWDLSLYGNSLGFTYKLYGMLQNYEESIEGVSDRLKQTSKQQDVSLKLIRQTGSSHTTHFNLDHNYEFLSQYDLAKEYYEVKDKSKYSTDLAISHNWIPTHYFELSPAVRFNNDEFYGQNISPLLSAMFSNHVSWLEGGLNIRTSIADGYKTPTLKQMYWRFDHGSLLQLGNSELEPEKSLSTQLNFEFLISDKTQFETNFFNNDIKNLIALQSDPELARQYSEYSRVNQYTNVDEARTHGIELFYKQSFNWLALNASYSYLDAINLDTGKTLPLKSKHQSRLGIDISGPYQLQLSLMYRYDSKQFTDLENQQYADAFDVLDLKLNHRMNQHLSWYLGIDNMLANTPQTYSTSGAHGSSGNDVFPNAPRFSYLGIKASF